MTALTPAGLLERLITVSGSQSAPAADVAAGGLAGGAAAKLAVAAIVAGGSIGGAALVGPLERSDGEREVRSGGGDGRATVAAGPGARDQRSVRGFIGRLWRVRVLGR